MKNKYLFWLLMILLVIFPFWNVDAEVCDAADVQRLKELSKNIVVDYQYLGDVNYDGNYQLYEVSFNFSGLDGDVYIREVSSEKRINGENEKVYVDSGTRYFNIYSSHCADIKINSITVELPKFNEYSLTDDCQNQASNLEICDEWYQGKINTSTYNKIIDEYYEELEEEQNSNDILELLKEYYLFVIIGVIVFIILIILFVIRYRKRNRLD